MPRGAGSASDALMYFEGRKVVNSDSVHYQSGGTGFIIWSGRKDGKICMCTAAHVVEDFLEETAHRYSLETYMKYITKPFEDPISPGYDQVVSSFTSTVHAELVAKSIGNSHQNSSDGDWALMLLDPRELPVASFTKLGYVFNPSIYSSSAGSFFIMGHPHSMGQRIADSLEYDTNWLRQYNASSPYFLLDNPPGKITGMATAASGGPVINTRIASAPVAGILWGKPLLISPGTLDPADILPYDLRNLFSTRYSRYYTVRGFASTKMSHPTLMAAIKRHCWPREDSAQIERTELYKQSVSVTNTASTAQFEQNRSVTSMAGIAAAADQGFGANNPGTTLLKANTLTVSCAVTADASLPVLYGLARDIKLEPGFSYAASGDYYMEMNSAAPETGSSMVQKARSDNTKPDETANPTKYPAGFTIYPNPSADGIFNIRFPTEPMAYRVAVHSIDGKLVHSAANVTTDKYVLNLSTLPRGGYVLSIFRQQTGEKMFSKTLAY